MSTRVIGALIMTHSDDNGLVLPPRIAGTKVAIVPIWKSDEEMSATCTAARELAAALRPVVGPVVVDDRDTLRPGGKYGEWERKGVPLRIEIGPRDLASEQGMLVARHDRKKQPVPLAGMVDAVDDELKRIQSDLYARACQRREENSHVIDSWDDFVALYQNGGGFAHCHWCGDGEVEQQIQDETGATIRNIPLERDETPGKCIRTGRPSTGRVVFAQSY